jgi:branched-chain amino acid transport system permease protein
MTIAMMFWLGLGATLAYVGLRALGVPAKVTEFARTKVGPRRQVATVVAVGLGVVGSLLAWTQFSGYPGRLRSDFHLGGARIFTFVLALGMLVALTNLPGRRRAALAVSWGLLGAVLITYFSILEERYGLGAFAAGIYLVLVAGALGVLVASSLDPDTEPRPWRRRADWQELLVIAASTGFLLYVIVYGLDIEDGERTSRFLSYLALIGAGAAALGALGVFASLHRMYERHRAVALTAAFLAAAVFPFTQGGNAYWIRVSASIGVFAAAAIGLNVVVGLAGLLDLGYIAFFGVGAYVGGLLGGAGLTTLDVHLPFVIVIVLAAIAAAVFGVLIGAPTLRLRGDYLAIVTLGFGEIFRITANNADGITRGPNGIANIPDLALGGWDFGEPQTILGVELPYFANYYFLELLFIALVALVFVRLNSSRIGRAWVAIREDETAAEAMGVNTIAMKLLAFAIGAFLAGAAGAINAHVGTQVSPESFTFLESVLLLAAVVLGGMGTVPGAILGAAALYAIPEKLRAFQDYRLMLFGVALILMMRFRPEGIIASTRRKREFHDEDPSEGDALGAATGAGLTGQAVME